MIKIYEQVGVAMTCRSFEEYNQMFMLQNELPQGGRILDVAAGAASFTARLVQLGYDAIACDPLYDMTVEEMELYGLTQHEIASNKLHLMKHAFVWDNYQSLEQHDDIRVASLAAFIAHYDENKQLQKNNKNEKNRYVTSLLPQLAFDDNHFDLVICNHFLFLYQEQFDYSFHLKSIVELIRITKPKGRIVIYPLVGFHDEKYPFLDQLLKELSAYCTAINLRPTSFRFLPSADTFLELIK